ncbi:BTAD domain-containing putative transcriptional regulator [Nonomuraea sp. NPDC049480]|uniref:BTAD domain-containing putative transcriptional regulator n=1 Tax=Nonomuraea sp. NPDC049480 TaxID=3364353 RepID=UPI0037A72A91
MKMMDIGGVRLRMLLARLAMAAGRPVSADSLIDDVWGDEPPSGAAGALQGLVSRLRKALRRTGTVDLVAGGYRLSVRDADVDALRFEELAGQGRRELAAGRPKEAASVLGGALGLWRGPALADVLEAPFARVYATRLEDVRAAAAEDYFDAELQLGRYAEVLSDLEAAGAERPLSERLAGLRMRALSAAGRQADALAVYEEIRAGLSEELGVDPSAALQETHLALLRGELERPQARPVPAASKLPGRLTSFIGRKAELDKLAELMAASRLVTIIGPGGAGKTRLSLETVSRDGAYQRGRVWFVPLARVSAPDQLVDAVAGALNSLDFGPPGGLQTHNAVDRVAELLDVGDAVLVLDNCEHLVQAAAELAEQLLDRLPQVRILATSREPLAITGEALCHLGPLELPAESPELAEAAAAAAVRLFVDRAADVRPGFVLEESTVDAVVEICRRLDGMPLALELAAAKLRSMSVDQIARRLDDRFRLLTSGSRTALPRQRTLLALVEWSWDLLEEPERVLARRLSIFPGGATVDALEAICSDEALPAEDVLYVLGSLVEKSIVQASGEDEERYQMLETIRAYAGTRLAMSEDDISGRFADHFLALAEEHEPLLRTGEQLRAIAVFDAEHDNLIFALQTTLDAGDALMASRFVTAMFWYWGIRGMNAQFETFLAAVLKFGDALPDEARAAFSVVYLAAGVPVTAAQADSLSAGADSIAARMFHPALPLLQISQMASATGDFGLTEHQRRQALSSPDPWVRASAQWAWDFVLTQRGDLRTGAAARLEALRGFEAVGDRWGLVMSLLNVGRDHSLRGEYSPAIAAFERAVAISSELGTEEYLFSTKSRLAQERMRSGDLDGALRDIHAARRQAKERGHRRLEANLLSTIADVHCVAGDTEQADQALDRLEGLVHRLPYPEEMARDMLAGMRMAVRLGEGAAVQARELLPRAVRGYFARGDSSGMAWPAALLARLLVLENDPQGAATALGMSQVIRGEFDEGCPELRALVTELIGRLGEDGYREAYRRGAELPRQDALNRLAEQAGQPVSTPAGAPRD